MANFLELDDAIRCFGRAERFTLVAERVKTANPPLTGTQHIASSTDSLRAGLDRTDWRVAAV